MKTIGLSPKLIPAIVAILVGLVLILIQGDDTLGSGILVTGISALGVGYLAPPGNVTFQGDPEGNGIKAKRKD